MSDTDFEPVRLGYLVHFKVDGENCRAAVVVKVWSDTVVNLTVFDPGTIQGITVPVKLHTSIGRGPADDPGSWHLPEDCPHAC